VRYVPEKPFPAYTHTPGVTPHPVKSPEGHSYGKREPAVPPLDRVNWSQSAAYLYAVDLFNHGYYWEAHESWEGLWHATGRQGTVADFLKGLIKLAAAGVKRRQGIQAGVETHCRRAAALFRDVRQAVHADRFAGADLNDLIKCARTTGSRVAESGLSSAYAPEPVFTWRLVLR